ncbi:MAG: galactose oxidase [Acidobacteriales bacterium]|nr:galactose oxidase [Terriglobales bacterium]
MSFLRLLAPVLVLGMTAAVAQAPPPLPKPVSNNAIVSFHVTGGELIFSLLGIGPGKKWRDITQEAYIFDSRSKHWKRMPDVPGPAGRLASAAVGANGKVFLFGGYTVDKHGKEVTLNQLDIYSPGAKDPSKGIWTSGRAIPIPVDDSVALIYHGRFVILVSGWSGNDNVSAVQVYDIYNNTWRASSAIPGRAVFGHAGGISGETIVYCGGAYKPPAGQSSAKYVASEDCWRGAILTEDASKISWSRLPKHPGDANYRMGASGMGAQIVFSGGTDNPYNYDGIGYNGVPSGPSAVNFAWDIYSRTWKVLPPSPSPTMDHRALVRCGKTLCSIGGMSAGQRVTDQVNALDLTAKN